MIVIIAGIAGASAAVRRAAGSANSAPAVNIRAKCDSALILADGYAEAVAQKPEFAPARLNILRDFYAAIPDGEARDSVCSRLFDFYVNYVEAENAPRAEAFKTVYLALAPDNDEHLGRIYLNELNVARENFDTTGMEQCILRLADYADRMQYDYDEELSAAKAFIRTVRNRPPLRQAIAGVWVSDDVDGVELPDGRVQFSYGSEKMALINSLKVIQIRETDHPIYHQDITKENRYQGVFTSLDPANGADSPAGQRNLDVIKCREGLASFSVIASTPWYVPVEAWELPAHNMAPLDSSYVAGTKMRGSLKLSRGLDNHLDKFLSRMTVTNDTTYSMYTFWGDTVFRRNDPEIGAILRQTTQQSQAAVAGHMSRSNHSFGDRLAANLTAGLVSAGVNAAVDALMVSSEKIWGLESVMHMVNPNELDAEMFAQLVISKSNSNTPENYEYRHRASYYRWVPSDSVVFLGMYNNIESPWNGEHGIIYLHEMTDADKDYWEQKVKDYKKVFKDWYKAEIKKREEYVKSLPKGSAERKSAAEALKSLKAAPPQLWQTWNREMLNRLKRKSENRTI